jgi:hypothetical protein
MRGVLIILSSPIVCDYLIDIYKTRPEQSLRRECASLLYDCAVEFGDKYLDILLRDPDEFIASVGVKYLKEWSYFLSEEDTDIGVYLELVANHPHPSISSRHPELVKFLKEQNKEKG